MTDNRRLTIVQYAGDVREASERLNRGGEETYGGQRYTVEFVEALARRLGSVITIVGFTDEAYDCMLPSGMRAVGAGFKSRFDPWRMLQLVRASRPDILILRTPVWTVLLWAIAARCRTLVLIADSFNAGSWKGAVKLRLLALLLRSSVFDVVANHGRRSAQQLANAGVPAQKVLAWDYPPLQSPDMRPVKDAASGNNRVLFVGTLSAEKGVLDLIDAAAISLRNGRVLDVHLVGSGDIGKISTAIADRQLNDLVHLVGPIPNPEVLGRMADADIVVVPSRHEYSEGVPLTIYEAFCSRTPLVASDHPMFVGSVVHGESGLIFPAGNAEALSFSIIRLLDDKNLYRALSEGSQRGWDKLQNPVKWADLIDKWLGSKAEKEAWILENTL